MRSMKLLSARRSQSNAADGETSDQPSSRLYGPLSTGDKGARRSSIAVLADIVDDNCKRAVAPIQRLSPTVLSSDSAANGMKVLNDQAEKELERLYLTRHELKEFARRVQPADEASASQHAELALQHLREALARMWAGCVSACCGSFTLSSFRDCCTPRAASSPLARPARKSLAERTPQRAGFQQSPTKSAGIGRSATARRGARSPSPDRGVLGSNVSGSRVVHADRLLKRAQTRQDLGEAVAESAESKRSAGETKVLEDKANSECRRLWLWSPVHSSRNTWDLIMLTLIVYSCITVPYRIGMDAAAEGAVATFEVAVTVLFIVDLIGNFNTGYVEGAYVVVDRCKIAQNYVASWFWIDLASSFPYEALSSLLESMAVDESGMSEEEGGQHSSSFKMLRALRLFRLLRLLRLLRLQQRIDEIEDKMAIDLQILQLVKMVGMMLYTVHLLGCFWFFMGSMNFWNEEATWLTSYDDGSALSVNGATIEVQYLYSVYWALTTLTTVGYGDITPANNGERGYALFALLVGALVFGYMLNAIGGLVAALDKDGARVAEKLADVKEFTRWHKMSPELAAQVRKYYDYYYSTQGPVDDAEIIDKLAPALSHDVMEHILSQTVCKLPFFFVPAIGKSHEEQPPPDNDFMLALYPHLRPMVLEAGEIIMSKNTAGGDLIFVMKGRVYAAGGDMDRPLFPDTLCDVSFVAQDRCEFYHLDVKTLLQLVARFPHARPEFARFTIEDTIEHKKQRIWSLRFAQCEKMPKKLPEEAALEFEKRRIALQLQVAWLRKALARYEHAVEGGSATFDAVLPVLFGKTPKAEAERIRKRKLNKRDPAKLPVEIFDGVKETIGVYPRGGAITPRMLSAPASVSNTASATSAAAPAAGKSKPVASAASEAADVAPSAVGRIRALQAESAAADQAMVVREQQLHALQAEVSRALSELAQRPNVTATPGQNVDAAYDA